MSSKQYIAGSIQIVDGTQGAGKILISDSFGVASWTSSFTSLQSGVFKANISQRSPEYRVNDELPLGTIWTIATYSIGDDFSNMELIRSSTFSGTINGTGSVLRAINGYNEYNTQPTVWSNGSVLTYDGRPYYTSINSNGNYGPFYNSFNQDFNLSYVNLGVYAITSTGSFISGKHSFSITNHSGDFNMIRSVRQDNDKYWIIANDIGTQEVYINGITFSNTSPNYPIGYTASFNFANKDSVLNDASITIERWV
jgi:hypothetical protein